jgi:hypothetical protein
MAFQASSIVAPNSLITATRAVAFVGASIAAAGIAASLVGGGFALGLSLFLGRLDGAGLGAIVVVILLSIPVLAVMTLVGPFAAGLAGGFAGSRPVATVGSVGGLFAGYWVGLMLGGDPDFGPSSVQEMVALVGTLSVVTMIGHFTALALRRALQAI